MLHTGSTYNRRGDVRLGQHPGQGFLRHGAAMGFRDCFQIIYHFFVHSIGSIPYHGRNIIDFITLCHGAPGMGAATAGQRTPGYYGQLPVLAQRHDFPFFFPVNQIVLWLQGNEFRPVVPLRNTLQAFQLPGENGRRADVTGFAALHHVVQRFHDFFHGCVGIQTVDLIHIHIIQAQPFQAVVNFCHDIFTGQTAAVRTTRAHFKVYFRCYHDLIPVQAEIPDETSGDFFAGTHLINVGRIEIVDTQINCFFENILAFFIRLSPGENTVFLSGFAKAHHSQANVGNVHPCITEFYILHCVCLLFWIFKSDFSPAG